MSDADDALGIIYEVFNLGTKWDSLTHEQLLNLLERTSPHRSVDWVVGAKGERANQAILNLIWAITGDAYVRLDRPIEAADAYRRAATYRRTSCFSDNYVKLVLKHHLADHYEPARSTMERSLVEMKKYNMRFRFFCNWFVFGTSPRGYFKYYVIPLLKRARRLRELDRRIRLLTSDKENGA